MNHALRPSFSPQASQQPMAFPPPSPEALNNAGAADAWLNQAVNDAGEILYRDRPGMPHRAAHDSQVLARAYAARATAKGWLNSILMAAGRLPHIADGPDVSDGAARLLYRLAALLSREGCNEGQFRVTACNATLAQEMDKTERSIQRYLAELQQAGWIYRHFTTGPIGLQRPAIDLGPAVERLAELEDAISVRATARAELRADRSRCATLALTPEQVMSGGGDSSVTHNTNDSKSDSETVTAQEGTVAGKTCGKLKQGADGKGVYHPVGRPEFIPKVKMVVEQCPTLAAYVRDRNPAWPDLIDAASLLASTWGMNEAVWKSLCINLGREWAAITVATVAELPESRFTRSNAPRIEMRRASYVAGIAKKIAKGEEASVTSSWFRLVKQKAMREGTIFTRSN